MTLFTPTLGFPVMCIRPQLSTHSGTIWLNANGQHPSDLIAERPDSPFQPTPSSFDPWQREALELRPKLEQM